MHNACPKDIINSNTEKTLFAIFNRNLSERRKKWLKPSIKHVNIVEGKFGNDYIDDLRRAQISVNIHFSDNNLDDFKTGIFEAMASGCLVISERLNKQTLMDLDMEKAIIQVSTPVELYKKLKFFKDNPDLIQSYQLENKNAINKNTWHDRAKMMQIKFKEIYN